MTQREPASSEIAAAKAAGFDVHTGDGSDPTLQGKWWWSLHQDGWSGVETSDREFDTETAAWADAVEHLDRDEELRRPCGGCA